AAAISTSVGYYPGSSQAWGIRLGSAIQQLGQPESAAPCARCDIRRSVATGMANLRVLPHVIQSVLNHVGGFRAGVASVYNRATYEKEMREALERWAEHVDAITRL